MNGKKWRDGAPGDLAIIIAYPGKMSIKIDKGKKICYTAKNGGMYHAGSDGKNPAKPRGL
jgi:hypothetical protein